MRHLWYIHSTGAHRPTNLRITFMGDSVSRFQYLALVAFLRKAIGQTTQKNWIGLYQNIMSRWTPTTLTTLTSNLKGMEQCDCHDGGGPTHERWVSNNFENRYFSDPALLTSHMYKNLDILIPMGIGILRMCINCMTIPLERMRRGATTGLEQFETTLLGSIRSLTFSLSMPDCGSTI